MPQAQSFYESQAALTSWFVMVRIGEGLRERYQVQTELLPELLTLVRKLDDRDWLFPSVSGHNDVDLFGG
jgi:hypothetical protein